LGRGLDWVTHRGPFQHQTFYDSVKIAQYGCPLLHLVLRPGDRPGSSGIPVCFRVESCSVPRALFAGTFMTH